MRNPFLINLAAIFSIGALGSSADCSNEKSLTAVNPSIYQGLQPCINQFCASINNTKETSKSFKTLQCHPVILTVTHVNDTLPPTYDRDRCIDGFSSIITQCLIAQGSQGSTLTDEALYEVDPAQNKAVREIGLPDGDDTNLALADRRVRGLEEKRGKSTKVQKTQKTTAATQPTKSTKKTTPTTQTPKSTKKTTPTTRPTKSTLTRQPTASKKSCNKPRATGKVKKRANSATCKSKRSVSHIFKRASTLAQIYKTINPKITTGNTKAFNIDPKKEVAYGATECIGCSVVIIITGKQILVGHYPEEAGNPPNLVLGTAGMTKEHIISRMEDELATVDEPEDVYAWLIHSGNTNRPAGARELETHLEENFKCVGTKNFHWTPLQYVPIRVPAGGLLDDIPNGKIVVTVKPLSNGEVEIAIYNNNDTPKWIKRFNADGKPCN